MENFTVSKYKNNNFCRPVVQLSKGDIVEISNTAYDILPDNQKNLFTIVKIKTKTLRPQNIKDWLKFWEWKTKGYFKKNILGYKLMFKGE